MDLMNCVCTFHKYYKKHLKGLIRTFFKRTEYQREQVTPEAEGNVPSNAIKSDLIVID